MSYILNINIPKSSLKYEANLISQIKELLHYWTAVYIAKIEGISTKTAQIIEEIKKKGDSKLYKQLRG